MAFIESDKPQKLSVFTLFAFVGISWLLFAETRGAGFVTDWFGWEYKYRDGSWSDVIKSFGYKGLHPVLHFFNYFLYTSYGKSTVVWYLVFAALHGTNAWLSASLYLRLLGQRSSMSIALLVGLLVLVSPYAVEVVVWRVCLHYLLVLFFTLAALHQTLSYLEFPRTRDLIFIHIFFLLALFSLEWALVMPGLIAVCFLWQQLEQRKFALRPLALITGVQAALIAGWFSLNKLVLGQYIGHYGASTHLKFEPLSVLTTLYQYFVKHLLFMRYWRHPQKEAVFQYLEHPKVVVAMTLLLIAIFIYPIYRFYKHNKSAALVNLVPLICFFIALLPVANLYFYYIDYSENDRYGYFAIPFFWIWVASICGLLKRYLSYSLLIGALIVSSILMKRTTRAWSESNEMYRSLVSDFHWYDKEEVLILGIPDNYRGVLMFRIYDKMSGFQESLELYTNKPFKGRMADVVNYNAQTLNDALKVKVDSTGMLYKTSFVHDGSWWMWHGMGASDRSTDWFDFTKKEWHNEIKLKVKNAHTAVIYPVNGKWVEVK
jgi:hypothetical protein